MTTAATSANLDALGAGDDDMTVLVINNLAMIQDVAMAPTRGWAIMPRIPAPS